MFILLIPVLVAYVSPSLFLLRFFVPCVALYLKFGPKTLLKRPTTPQRLRIDFGPIPILSYRKLVHAESKGSTSVAMQTQIHPRTGYPSPSSRYHGAGLRGMWIRASGEASL